MSDLSLNRGDLLSGRAGGRRASLLLFAIEQRVRLLLAESRQAAAWRETSSTAGARESGFFQALGEGRTESTRGRDGAADPRIRGVDLERFAKGWEDLCPSAPASRAALYAEMVKRHELSYPHIPTIRSVLDLDTDEVAQALTAAGIADPAAVAPPPPTRRAAARWRLNRVSMAVDELPPALLAFAIVFTSMVGGGVLALPLALAGLGLGAGLLAIGAAGGLYGLAMLAMIEAFVRTSHDRRAGGAISVVVAHYLGPRAARAAGLAMVAVLSATIVAYTFGFGRAMGAATGTPDWVWAMLLAAAALVLLRRRSLDATVVLSLTIGFVNLALLMVLVGSGFSSGAAHEGAPAFLEVGEKRALVAVVFGFLVSAFSAQVGVLNASDITLRREPTGRALATGTIAAIAAAIVVYGGFLAATFAAVDRTDLLAETGTVVGPLADATNAAVPITAGAYAVLAMGLLTVQLALALRNQMRAWLPARLARAGVDGLPTLACAAAGIVLLSTEYDAFLDLLAAVGALADPVVAGIFSGLVLIAATRRGQRAGRRRLWSAAIATAVGVVVVIAYAFGIIAHAAVIWETPLRRVLAGSVAIVCVLLVVEAVVAHRFRRLSHVELEAVAGAGRTWRLHLVNPAATRVFGADLELVDGSRFGTTQLPLRIETGASTNRLRLQLPDDGLRLRGEPETPERRATEIMIDPADRGEVVVEAVGAVARPSTAHLPTRAAPAPVVPESPE